MAGRSLEEIMRPVGGWAAAGARAKQLLAGAVEGTIANSSETKDSWRPAILDAVPATAAVVASLINRRKDGKAFDGSNAVERYLMDSLRRAALASERTNQTLGIDNPQNTAETALRITGGLFIPSFKGTTIARVVSKVPGGAKVVEAARAIHAATPTPVRKVAKVAAEIATPFRQTGILAGAAIGTALTGLLDVVQDQQVDPSTGKKYKGAISQALGIHDAAKAKIKEEKDRARDDVPATQLDDLDQLMASTAVEAGDAPSVDDIMAHPIHPLEVHVAEEQDKHNRYQDAAIAIGAALGGGAMFHYANSFLQARKAVAVEAENIGKFTGKQFKSSKLGKKDRFVTEVFDQTQPLRSAARDFLGRDASREIGYELDSIYNTGIQSKARHAFATGQLPGTSMKTAKLAAHAEAYAKELTPDERLLVSDALNAASALDDFKHTGVLSAMTKDREGNKQTPKMLELLIQKVTSNPKYAKYYNVVQKTYDDMARYEVKRGLNTPQGYRELRNRRPNYVPMSRNLAPDAAYSPTSYRYSANADVSAGQARSLDPRGGVTGTSGVANPFVSLFDDWSDTIRRAEHNSIRAKIITGIANTNAEDSSGRKLIEAVSANTNKENTHTVKIAGKEQTFLVRDPEISRALHFTPRIAVPGLEQMRQFAQNFTTGPIASLFNFFSQVVAPVFDSGVAATIKNADTKIGLANHLFVGGYTGALRYLGDEITGAVGRTLRDNLIRDVSPLKKMLGETNLEKAATWFENIYENSVKAEMDALGITSHTMYGSPDPSKLLSGIDKLSPEFARVTEKALSKDVGRAYQAGDITAVKAGLLKLKSLGARISTNGGLRAYALLSEAAHNGARYTAYAANRGLKGTDKEAKLVSDMRRLTADTSKHGARDAVGVIVNSSMYGPVSMQTLFEIGKRARENPTNILFNIMKTNMTAAALYYLTMAYDDEAREKHMSKSPAQKATSLTLPGGAELPLDPIQRFSLTPALAILDNISGMNEGKFNPNFLEVMENWLDGDAPEFGEEFEKDFDIRMSKAVEDNMPVIGYNFESGAINLQSIPLASIAIASTGADPGMTRITGEVVPNREQDVTGLDTGSGKKPDSLVSAWTEGMITSIFSSTGKSVIGIADDAYRAFNHPKGGLKPALDMAAQSWKDKAVPSSRTIRGLFGEYESIKNINDINYELLKDREPGIEQAVKVLNKNYRSNGFTGVEMGALEAPENDAPHPELEGTELLYISSVASELSRELSRNAKVIGEVGDQIEKEKAQYLKPLEDRNKYINSRNEERKYQRMLMLSQIRQKEELISLEIGRPFTFDGFNPKEYLRPMAPTH